MYSPLTLKGQGESEPPTTVFYHLLKKSLDDPYLKYFGGQNKTVNQK